MSHAPPELTTVPPLLWHQAFPPEVQHCLILAKNHIMNSDLELDAVLAQADILHAVHPICHTSNLICKGSISKDNATIELLHLKALLQ